MVSSTAQKSTNVRTLPIDMRLAAFGLRSLGAVAPSSAATRCAELFCRPGRPRRPRREVAWLESAAPLDVRMGRTKLQAWRWVPARVEETEPPTVMLLHVWGGRGAQLGAFVEPLLEGGFQVVTWDGPGHGDSGGDSCSLMELADAAFAVARTLRVQPEALIAHSMGAGAGALAIAEGLDPRSAVWISPPASILHFINGYAGALRLTDPVRRRMIETMNRSFHVDLTDYDVEAMDIPHGDRMLVIHDEDDKEVPIEHGERVQRAANAAAFVRTQRLGHRRILGDAEVIARTVDWVRSRAQS
ncbi:MAG: alpha/beta hydrolase [Planctomycetota bacterium]